MNFEVYEYTIPTFYLGALINGDISGLSDEEERELNTFLESLPGNGHWDYDDEHYFSYYNDINNLGNDVTDCRYLVPIT